MALHGAEVAYMDAEPTHENHGHMHITKAEVIEHSLVEFVLDTLDFTLVLCCTDYFTDCH